MSPIAAFVAAALFAGAASLGARLADGIVRGIEAAATLRLALLVDPTAALGRFCATPRAGPCRLEVRWRTADGTPEEVCAAPPLDADDLRLRPRRHFAIDLVCPAPALPRGRMALRIRLAR